MRRGGPPMLAIDPGSVPAFSRVERGARGLRFAPVAAPADAAAEPGPPLRVHAGAPVGMRVASVVAEGALVLGAAPGMAVTLRAPAMHVIHDRRPPGLDGAVGAPGANAGLLRADGGWRAVVLPSLGDVVADLGDGPVAIRADGRRIAAAAGGGVEERDLGVDGPPAARHEGTVDALAYAGGTLMIARGAGVAAAGTGEPEHEGSPVVALAGAADAPRAAALHADGTVSVWQAGEPGAVAGWASPLAAAATIALSADGTRVALGDPGSAEPAACIAAAADGAQIRRVEGARAIAFAPEPEALLVAGDWGAAFLRPIEEDR